MKVVMQNPNVWVLLEIAGEAVSYAGKDWYRLHTCSDSRMPIAFWVTWVADTWMHVSDACGASSRGWGRAGVWGEGNGGGGP